MLTGTALLFGETLTGNTVTSNRSFTANITFSGHNITSNKYYIAGKKITDYLISVNPMGLLFFKSPRGKTVLFLFPACSRRFNMNHNVKNTRKFTADSLFYLIGYVM